MQESILAVVCILIGYYLGSVRDKPIDVSEQTKVIPSEVYPGKGWADDFVVRTNEYQLEQEQLGKETDDISLKSVLKQYES